MLTSVGVLATSAAVTLLASSSAFAASAPNPCKLVTAADVKTALGSAVGKSQLLPAGLYQSCIYSATPSKRLVVLVRQLSKSDFTRSAKANPGPVTAVSGIGGAAYSVGGGASLLVWKNGTEASFSIFGAGAPLRAEERLAKKVVAKLGG